MNTVADEPLRRAAALQAAIENACARVAPTWPLDAFIAVNPWWGWRDMPAAGAARELGQLAGTRLTLPPSGYRALMQAGAFGTGDLRAAIAQTGAPVRAEDVARRLQAADTAPRRLQLLTDLADAARDLDHTMAWGDFVTHHISQQCAAYFDAQPSHWPAERHAGLYASWLQFAQADPSAALLMGDSGVRARIRALPATADQVMPQALHALGLAALDPAAVQAYCTALLASIGGWAAWCAYLGWQARLGGGEDAHLRELLAVRLAWDWVLQPTAAPPRDWARQWLPPESHATPEDTERTDAWLLQSALELAWQRPLAQALGHAMALPLAEPPADVLAVFCIDVRSEVFRRALEASSPRVRTAGFAGFFGLPIAYRPLGADAARAQLPGLLAPRKVAEEAHDDAASGQVLAARRQRQGAWRQAWNEFRGGASSTFTFVEACGLPAAGGLLRGALGLPGGDAARTQAGLRPRLQAEPGLAPAASGAQRSTLLAGVLRAMGLAARDQAWPPLVLLAGHGSRSANNPFAAGLDCGACGGQTGEVNARVLAQLLNDAALREGLAAQGIRIPDGTRFVAGLHCTTTDDVELFDTDLLPEAAEPIAQLRRWLADAGQRARAERAPALGLRGDAPAAQLHAAIAHRSRDWSQTRPEWGLANNAGFIAAPRARTRHLDLGGRVFLHDYDWRADAGFAVLELVMTAPMVVANWINLQYHASVVDPVRYGSGNKVLHNVVGGRIGVFEGNGGDLRIGLPWQSVHDGQRFVHTPLRLSAFIEAPHGAIDAVLARHATVRQLVEHGWLHLFCMEPDGGEVLRRGGGGWRAEAGI